MSGSLMRQASTSFKESTVLRLLAGEGLAALSLEAARLSEISAPIPEPLRPRPKTPTYPLRHTNPRRTGRGTAGLIDK